MSGPGLSKTVAYLSRRQNQPMNIKKVGPVGKSKKAVEMVDLTDAYSSTGAAGKKSDKSSNSAKVGNGNVDQKDRSKSSGTKLVNHQDVLEITPIGSAPMDSDLANVAVSGTSDKVSSVKADIVKPAQSSLNSDLPIITANVPDKKEESKKEVEVAPSPSSEQELDDNQDSKVPVSVHPSSEDSSSAAGIIENARIGLSSGKVGDQKNIRPKSKPGPASSKKKALAGNQKSKKGPIALSVSGACVESASCKSSLTDSPQLRIPDCMDPNSDISAGDEYLFAGLNLREECERIRQFCGSLIEENNDLHLQLDLTRDVLMHTNAAFSRIHPSTFEVGNSEHLSFLESRVKQTEFKVLVMVPGGYKYGFVWMPEWNVPFKHSYHSPYLASRDGRRSVRPKAVYSSNLIGKKFTEFDKIPVRESFSSLFEFKNNFLCVAVVVIVNGFRFYSG
jgi:hypothetical protein